MVTWALENAIETADSMKSRGYGLRGRTAFSIYRMEDRDKYALGWLGFCGMYLLCGSLAGGLKWWYFPMLQGAMAQPVFHQLLPGVSGPVPDAGDHRPKGGAGMALFTVENLTFSYPGQTARAIDSLSLTVPEGAFLVLCGPSGCGKSTLLRQLKPALAPHGTRQGRILFRDTPLDQVDQRTLAARIGFVQQSPENQIVTDKVWHELAFGLESLGVDTPPIRRGWRRWRHSSASRTGFTGTFPTCPEARSSC